MQRMLNTMWDVLKCPAGVERMCFHLVVGPWKCLTTEQAWNDLTFSVNKNCKYEHLGGGTSTLSQKPQFPLLYFFMDRKSPSWISFTFCFQVSCWGVAAAGTQTQPRSPQTAPFLWRKRHSSRTGSRQGSVRRCGAATGRMHTAPASCLCGRVNL